MKKRLLTLFHIAMIVSMMLIVGATNATAQNAAAKGKKELIQKTSSPEQKTMNKDSALINHKVNDIIKLSEDTSLQKGIRNWATWKPSPKRALWLALVIPGAGQVYNRKFWKLPIIYGGIMGCLYAMNWNNMMYRDYSQAYLDIMDDDPNTASYNQFLHLGTTITSSNEEHYKTIFKNRKDYYRRYRDLSFFCLIGVYALSVIDAYVDAELSEFDISRDLSLKVKPAIINSRPTSNPLNSSAVGLQCSLHF